MHGEDRLRVGFNDLFICPAFFAQGLCPQLRGNVARTAFCMVDVIFALILFRDQNPLRFAAGSRLLSFGDIRLYLGNDLLCLFLLVVDRCNVADIRIFILKRLVILQHAVDAGISADAAFVPKANVTHAIFNVEQGIPSDDHIRLQTEGVFLHKISNILMVFHTVQLRESFLILRQNAAAVCRHQNLVFQPQRQHDLHIVFSIDQRPLRTLLKCIRHKFARIVVHLQCHGIIIFAVRRRRAYRPDGTGRRRCGGSRGRRGRPAPRTGSQAECQSQG